jgi:hypothetical protein
MALEVSWRPPVFGKKGQVSKDELGREREGKIPKGRRNEEVGGVFDSAKKTEKRTSNSLESVAHVLGHLESGCFWCLGKGRVETESSSDQIDRSNR